MRLGDVGKVRAIIGKQSRLTSSAATRIRRSSRRGINKLDKPVIVRGWWASACAVMTLSQAVVGDTAPGNSAYTPVLARRLHC